MADQPKQQRKPAGGDAPAQETGNDSGATPDAGPRVTHPPPGVRPKTGPDGRMIYPGDEPGVRSPAPVTEHRPTDADGRRDR